MRQASLSEALWMSSPSVSGAGRFDAATIAKMRREAKAKERSQRLKRSLVGSSGLG